MLAKQHSPRPNKSQRQQSAKPRLILYQRTWQHWRIPKVRSNSSCERTCESPPFTAAHFFCSATEETKTATNRWRHRWSKCIIFTKRGSAQLKRKCFHHFELYKILLVFRSCLLLEFVHHLWPFPLKVYLQAHNNRPLHPHQALPFQNSEESISFSTVAIGNQTTYPHHRTFRYGWLSNTNTGVKEQKGGGKRANSPLEQKANSDKHRSLTGDSLHGRESHWESSGGCDVRLPHSLRWCLELPASNTRLIKIRFQRKCSEHGSSVAQKWAK